MKPVLALLFLSACQLPDSADINNADMSVTFVTAGGAAHVLIACPKPPGPLITKPSPSKRG